MTPYEVKGKVDYSRLLEQFGVQPVTPDLLARIRKPHRLLRTGYFFAHRDFDKILDYYDEHGTFAVVSGRGPSEHMHLAHLLLYMFNLYLQQEFNAYVFVPFSDDEKFFFKDQLELGDVRRYSVENALDMIALGFDPSKTEFFFDTAHMNPKMYSMAVEMSRKVNFSTVRAVYGFAPETNIGLLFYPALQAMHILYPEVERSLPVVVPIAIDQDPHVRVSRDVAAKMGLFKPATLESKFMKGLSGEAKMSASEQETSIFTTDKPEAAAVKVMNAFTGGRATVEEQKVLGGIPEVCPVYEYQHLFFFDDAKSEKLYKDCTGGKILCGECKGNLARYVKSFLAEHQKRREEARHKLDMFIMKH